MDLGDGDDDDDDDDDDDGDCEEMIWPDFTLWVFLAFVLIVLRFFRQPVDFR